jgi:creatinine amidohydrolase/Fe(II)-dependent formamide hydrolase-like protein
MVLDAPGLHAGEVETSIREVSPIGVLGDPDPARAERGARYLADWVDLIARAVSSPDGR